MKTCTVASLIALAAAPAALAQSWVTFSNQTASRLVAAPSLIGADNLEKDFATGDLDRDGDVDLVCMRKFPGSIQGGFRNIIFMNEGGVLVDRTEQYGSARDISGYSGMMDPTNDRDVEVTDINDDGWPDFYVSNDYQVPDYYYINNRDGTFKNKISESIGHTSQFSMGNDVADINNDGWQDIITLDMLPEDNKRQKLLMAPDNYGKFELNLRSGFYYQFMRNMLQLNNGNGTFSEIGQFAGISNTDWSWSALAADYDNDGWKDIYITNGYKRDYTKLDFINYMDDYVKRKGRLMREDVLEIIQHMPASDVVNYMFRGSSGLKFTNQTKTWGLSQVANSNGAVYADLDNDGDLDLVVNNINKPAFIYENKARENANHYLRILLEGEGLNTQGIGGKVHLYSGSQQFMAAQFPARGYLSAVSPVLHFGLGEAAKVDSLVVTWPGGKQETQRDVPVNTTITLLEKNAKAASSKKTVQPGSIFKAVQPPIAFNNPPLQARDFDRQKLLISELSTQGPCIVKGDLNGDGLEDIFAGGASGQSASVFLQKSNGSFAQTSNPAFEQDKQSEDVDAVIFDANGDGFADIYVASGGYHQFQSNDPLLQDRLYLNDGKGLFTKSPDALPEMHASKGCVAVADVNGDGHLDMFVGGRVVPGRYPEAPASYLLVNDGKGTFSNQINTIVPELASPGMVCDAAWADVNRDGQADLLVVGEWLPLSIFINQDGKLKNETNGYLGQEYRGFWNRIEVADVNKDQVPDFIIGNLGTNTQIRATGEQPAELYFADFDQNGSVDPLLCTYIQGKSWPYVTRDELLAQLVPLRKRFTSYESYANTTLNDLFSAEELSNAGHLSANYLETSILISTSSGKHEMRALPAEAQFAPVYAIQALDFDKDGNQDLLLCGNNSHLKLRLGKSDANYGMLFQGDGKGDFSYVDQVTSGLKIRGDVRCVVQIGDVLLFGINQQALAAYRL